MVKIARGDVTLAVTDHGGDGPPLLLLLDHRGHGHSTRRPADLSRKAFGDDVVCVLQELAPRERCVLVGQSMGAHTAMLVTAARPDLVDKLVMLEGHAAGSSDAARLGRYFASWPLPFADKHQARAWLGGGALAEAWLADLEMRFDGLYPRFDADIMERTLQALQEPRWSEWESLAVPALAVFAGNGMFDDGQKDELIRRRPGAYRIDLRHGSHDAHLDAGSQWITALTGWLQGAG